MDMDLCLFIWHIQPYLQNVGEQSQYITLFGTRIVNELIHWKMRKTRVRVRFCKLFRNSLVVVVVVAHRC